MEILFNIFIGKFLFFQAYKHNFYGDNIVYIFIGLINQSWFTGQSKICSWEKIFKAANGTITFHKENLRQDPTPTIFQKVK